MDLGKNKFCRRSNVGQNEYKYATISTKSVVCEVKKKGFAVINTVKKVSVVSYTVTLFLIALFNSQHKRFSWI